MEKIKRISLSEQVLDSVIDYVQVNNLTVGDKLPTEGEFAELFQVSRTSVREGYKALSINGAIKSIPGKGTFVSEAMTDVIVSRTNGASRIVAAQASIDEIMEMRTALEILAVELAIDRGTEEGVSMVEEAMSELTQNVMSGKPWEISGTKFHTRIAEMSGNSLLLKTVDMLANEVGRYKEALFQAETNMDRHIKDHQNILNALRAKDKAAARIAVTQHMTNTENDIKRLVNERNATYFVHKYKTK